MAPNGFKVRNQVAAGFEQTLFEWLPFLNMQIVLAILITKRFINYTWDAVEGIAEQLSPVGKMAWESTLMLDTT